MADIPTGGPSTAVMNPTNDGVRPSLPGSVPTTLPTPILVATTPNTPVPEFWNEASRVIADVFKLYETDPIEAAKIWAWVKIILADIVNKKGRATSSGASGSSGSSGN